MTAQVRRNVWRWSFSITGGLVAAVFVFAVLLFFAGLARADEVAEAPPRLMEVPGWGASTARVLLAGVACLFVIEGLRWAVPGWEREPGVRLGPSARRVILLTVIAFGQLCAFIGWPNNTLVTTPYPNVLMASLCAGLVVSIASVVLNETLWKRLVKEIQDRFGVMPRRVKERQIQSGMTTGQFRALRDEPETSIPPEPPPGT